jgi:hypothetical protein
MLRNHNRIIAEYVERWILFGKKQKEILQGMWLGDLQNVRSNVPFPCITPTEKSGLGQTKLTNKTMGECHAGVNSLFLRLAIEGAWRGSETTHCPQFTLQWRGSSGDLWIAAPPTHAERKQGTLLWVVIRLTLLPNRSSILGQFAALISSRFVH